MLPTGLTNQRDWLTAFARRIVVRPRDGALRWVAIERSRSSTKGMRIFALSALAAVALVEPLHGQAYRVEPECPPARDSLRIVADVRLASTLAGEVTNRDTGRPIYFASVTLQPGDQRVTTDSLGAFRISPAPDGRYVVRIRAIGFAEYSDTLTVTSSTGMRVHIPLVPQYFDRCPTLRRVPVP